ncbi:Acyl-CoA N-acyltransferase [Penicillium soppii]|uniref:Acyl-CoA N-acyltransferase n=1 Tax=Penicillium soppii TaxID=69789 RepID=UPI0025498923|nr:Acyl-CoA N-acyltransferase [Penicillium soppii]KAJ5861867.1 Acyl-CoA N-acyltransferase [Penicillium soppii]
MASSVSRLQHKSWTNGSYLISTDTSLIPVPTLNAWFASDDWYWAKAIPEQVLHETLQQSLCFGMYHESDEASKESEFMGFARCITDFTTFIYLTDVYVLPSHQGRGLGKWLMKCVQEVIESMPYLRRSLLFTEDWKRSVPFYKDLLGMDLLQSKPPTDESEGEGLAVLMRKGKGNPGYQET